MSERPLYVAEVFGPTFQGEGPSAGQRAGFVRLGGCNLACTWCDTAYTWDARRYDLRAEIGPQSVAQLLAALDAMAVPLVVITGGEPLLQTRALTPLVAALSTRGLRVEVETNGTRPPPGWPWAGITFNVSPKLAHSGNAAARAALGRALLAPPRADPQREGLRATPARWARWWVEFLDYDAGATETAFEAIQTDQLVVLRGIPVWSICEHHLLPFACTLTIGYLAGARVLGISKLARVAQRHAHRLQLQERLVDGIATEISRLAGTEDVAVLGEGQHLCLAARGVRTTATMYSSALWGRFRTEGATRQEFFALAGRRGEAGA
jgi:GTP cyclohydrolase I